MASREEEATCSIAIEVVIELAVASETMFIIGASYKYSIHRPHQRRSNSSGRFVYASNVFHSASH